MNRNRSPLPRLALLLTVGAALALTGCQSSTSPAAFAQWPAGSSPAEVGRRVAQNFANRKLEYETNPNRKFVIYPEVCAWYGSLAVAQLTGDKDLQSQLVRKFDPLLTPEGAKRISPNPHVDYHVFGALPLELYI